MRKVLLAFLCGMSLFAEAADVSKMAILGIKLGDKYENIKKKLPCQDREDLDCGFWILCSTKRQEQKERLQVRFDHNSKVVAVRRIINFDSVPDWNLVTNSLIAQYGIPEFKSKETSADSEPGFGASFCWGDCVLEESNSRYWTGNRIRAGNTGDFFRIWHGGLGDKYALEFTLINYKVI